MTTTRIIDAARLEEFMGRFVHDLGAGLTAPLALLGDRLGLYEAMADGAPVTPTELAERTGCHERYIREWLCQQAASGYVDYDAAASTFRLPPEQALALADEQSPAFIAGAFQVLAAIVKDEPHISERSGRAPASAGTSTTTTCSRAPSASSAPGTSRTWSTPGCRRSKAWPRSSRPARTCPTSAAGTAPRRS
jgi:hypothetical protein